MSQRLQTHKIPLSHWCPETRMLGVGAPAGEPGTWGEPPAPAPGPQIDGPGMALPRQAGRLGSPKAPSAAPEQVHLSYPGETGCMTVTWTTWVPTPSEVQLFGLQLWGPLPLQAQGTFSPFMDGGILWRKLYIHRPNHTAGAAAQVYRCGSTQGWSRRFLFRALKNGPHWSPCLAVFGDIGTDNPRALPRLCSDTQQGRYDAVLHVGDFTYNVDQDNAHVRDKFMNLIEPVAASLPYVTCPGNHEDHYNFSNYKARFIMPGDSEGLWYRAPPGRETVSLAGERPPGNLWMSPLDLPRLPLLQPLPLTLRPSLQKANKNPAAPPWIITMGHRPMYCSSADWDDCTWRESKVRRGLLGKFYELEDLFYKYGVDLQLWAHERSYEHPWPIYNYHVFNGSREMPYTHPRVPVHIITGSAASRRCEERLTPLTLFPRPWSAVLIKEHGYTRLHNLNETRVHIQQVSDDQIVDDVWVMRPLLGRMMYLWGWRQLSSGTLGLVSDWTISTNQRLERRCPEPSSAPERALPPAQSAPLLWGLVDGEGGKPRMFVGDSTWRRQWPWWRRRKRAEG
ncbi:hypothetical protein EI555_019865, partial [Monodon monoceros]